MTRHVLVYGSRTYGACKTIERELDRLPEDVVLVHGACPDGADRIAEMYWCGIQGRAARSIPADWARHGRAAGILRNQQLLDTFHPVAALGFHDKPWLTWETSPGTYDMTERLKAAGIPYRLYGRDTLVRVLVQWKQVPLL